jgi:SAM-dependent MidA family methyltransferase
MTVSPLQQLIVERIQRSGPISFADYMRVALYEPDYGYYVTGPARMGWEGKDYYTSTDVSAFFAHCMGRQLLQMWELLGNPAPFTVVEQGAGRGTLADGIRLWAQQEASTFYAALDYRTEDIRTGQNALIQSATSPSVILSNELVDAFPVHVVQLHAQKLYEVYIAAHPDGHLYEVLDEPSSAEIAAYLDSYKIPWTTFPDGWRAEINLDALHWLTQSAQLLGNSHKQTKHGFLLAIDYGDKARALYTPLRPDGTLVCYFQHQLTNRPLVRPGEQDITAHVNFSALIDEGRRQGLRLHTFTTQRLWLTEMGIYAELERVRARDYAVIDNARASDQGQVALVQWYNLRQGVMTLTDTEGMGKFKVLILKR